jgi:phospholipid/cholesterol/gamma-HCH transport system permease protein
MGDPVQVVQPAAALELVREAGQGLTVRLSGRWTSASGLPGTESVAAALDADPAPPFLGFDTAGLAGWDSGLLTFLLQVKGLCDARGVEIGAEGLPEGARKLLALALAVPERAGARRSEQRVPFLERVGKRSLEARDALLDLLRFVGETCIAFGRLVRGKALFRGADFLLTMREVGYEALGIVSLISFTVGLIFAFVGAVQLRQFGAQIYVADLVGIAVLREMGAIMTGIILAGRTGAAFAAEIGTMQVNEEVDAFRTLGVSPVEFLVLPRMLALIIMTPLLTMYANVMGILGGFVVGVTMLDIGAVAYYGETVEAVSLNDLGIGLFMGLVFGILVAVSGCLRGMGRAATSAVVTGIIWIVVATGLITVICDVVGI